MAAVRSVWTTSQRGADDGAGQGHLSKTVSYAGINGDQTTYYVRTHTANCANRKLSRQLDGVHFGAHARAAGGARDPLQVGAA